MHERIARGFATRRFPTARCESDPGEIAIGIESLPHVSPVQRGLYKQAVAAAGVDPDNVLVVRITETSIEVDALDPDDARWPVRTHRAAPADCVNGWDSMAYRRPVQR